MKRLTGILLLIWLFGFVQGHSGAIDNIQDLAIIRIIDLSGDCGQTVEQGPFVEEGLIVEARLTATGTVNDSGGANTDYFVSIIKDGTNKTIMYTNQMIDVGATQNVNVSWNLEFSPTPNARPWTLYIYEGNTTFPSPDYGDTHTPLASLTFDPADWASTCAEEDVEPSPDDRLNRQSGDDTFVVYPGAPGSDELVNIYGVDDQSQGYYLLSISHEDADFYAENPPDTAIELQRVGDTAVFALPTGEIQVNMYSARDGKTHVLVFNAAGEVTNSYVLDGVYLNL